ncbi:MAG: isopeptide-forming domain-containing fimbrial protein [Oscillospiraceae bacterium]|nr:isopeptide-forming domain-containing fimbrial protein [Oscillospiraceae bacterium]
MKKFFALVLAIMMVMSLALPAAATTVSVSFTHPDPGHTFTAYQIFDGDLTDGHVMSNVTWGTGIQNGDKLIEFLVNDDTEIEGDGATIIVKNEFAGATAAKDIAEELTDWTSDGARLDYLAEVIGNGAEVSNVKYNFLATGKSNDVGKEVISGGVYTYKIDNLDPGYYLIKDTTANINGEDFRTKYMLLLTNHTDITTKGDYSTVDKKVKDPQTGIYGDSVSQHLNKELEYKWTVDLDEYINWYDTYYLKFTDTMSKGLKFEHYDNIYFLQNDNSKVYLMKEDPATGIGVWESGQADLVTQNAPVDTATGTTFGLEWNDIKKAFPDVDGDHTFVVEYTVTVTKDAVYGVEGNPNEVYITFSNSPSSTGQGDSVSDDAVAFDYQLVVDKVDTDDVTKKLKGAEFYLYHMHGSEKEYAVVDETSRKITSWVPDTAESIQAAKDAIDADTALSDDEKTTKKTALDAKPVATKLITDSNGAIAVKGLTDAVTYYLHETKAPSGYNLMFSDVAIKITAGHMKNDVFSAGYVRGSDGKLTYTALQYSVDGHKTVLTSGDEFTHGIVTAQVKNDAGNTLPSTGGMGTTLFYVFGSIMVLGALVLLITKKRMAAEN